MHFMHIENHVSTCGMSAQMPNYRRAYTSDRAIFLTLVIFNRRSIFAELDKFEGEG
jgi:hypothetical protein